MDLVVWQDREVKFDIFNVLVECIVSINETICFIFYPISIFICLLVLDFTGKLKFVVVKKFWTFSIMSKTQREIQMNEDVYSFQICDSFGIR